MARYRVVLTENPTYLLEMETTTPAKKIYLILTGDTTYFSYVVAGSYFSMGINTYGKAWSWGYNAKGQLGNNSTTNRSTPIEVYGSHTFCVISGTEYVMLSIDNNGKAWAWGDNTYGNIGINTTGSTSTPVAVCGGHTFCKIQGGQVNVALDYNGKAWAWGRNTLYGGVGDNSTESYRCMPVAVCGNHTFCKIFVGSIHSFGIDNHNGTWGWGINQNGQIGINSVTTGVLTPTKVLGNHTFCEIGAGLTHTVGIDNHGKAWGWGSNLYGELGTNNLSCRSTPVAVHGSHTFSHILSGVNRYTIALDNNGKAWSWGYNYNGYLGNDDVNNVSTPVAVCGNHTFCSITTRFSHSFAKDHNGMWWGWGSNNSGELGTGTTSTCIKTPIRIYLPAV